jgi:hypothetical protein
MDACHNPSFDPATRRLWSLWDMLELDAREFIEMIHALLTTERQIRGQTGELTPMLRATRNQANDEMIASLKKLELPVSVKTAQEMVIGAKTIEALHRAIEQLHEARMPIRK